MGCLVLMVLLFCTLLSISSIIEILFRTSELKLEKYFIVLILLAMLYLMYRRYGKGNTINHLVEKYKEEQFICKQLRGWLLIIYFLLVIAIPISVGYMRHNLGMDI